MSTESSEYEIKLYPRGPNSCEWKVWATSGGLPKASGVARNFTEANKAAQRAKERLEGK